MATEAEEVLCRESAQVAQQATEAQAAMDQHYKANGVKQKPIYVIYVNPTAPKRSPSHLSRRRHIWNTSSSTLFKRDSSSPRHKPFDKLKLRNNKQRQQPVNMNLLFKNSNDKPKNNQSFSNSNGDDNFLSSPRTRQRSMSCTLNCSTCVRGLRCSHIYQR